MIKLVLVVFCSGVHVLVWPTVLESALHPDMRLRPSNPWLTLAFRPAQSRDTVHRTRHRQVLSRQVQ